MKLFFISLLLLISYTVFGKYDPKYLLEYMKNDPIPLNYGITQQNSVKISDFSNIKILNTEINTNKPINVEAIIPFTPVNDYWYIQDFAEDPFDGRIEVVVGEPLPSVPLTIFIASIMLFTLMKYRNYIIKEKFRRFHNFFR